MPEALLVIDVQNEYFTGSLPVTYPNDSLDNILQVTDAARECAITVVVIQHTAPPGSRTFAKGTPAWGLHPEIRKRDWDHLVEKKMPGSFTGTDLEEWLGKRCIDTVTICGYMTQMCCDTTARQAYHSGFSVNFLSDATGTLSFSNAAGTIQDVDLHRAILITQAMRFSRVITADQWIREKKKNRE